MISVLRDFYNETGILKRKPRKFFLHTKGENGIMKRETEPEEELPAFRGSKSSKGEWRL